MLRPEDDYDALKDFNHSYEGTTTPLEEMHLEYQQLFKDYPDLAERLAILPGKVFSGKEYPGPESAWKKIRVIKADGKGRILKVIDEKLIYRLQDYPKPIRQVAITGHGKIKPCLIITNDFELKLEDLVRKYTRRWIVEKGEVSDRQPRPYPIIWLQSARPRLKTAGGNIPAPMIRNYIVLGDLL